MEDLGWLIGLDNTMLGITLGAFGCPFIRLSNVFMTGFLFFRGVLPLGLCFPLEWALPAPTVVHGFFGRCARVSSMKSYWGVTKIFGPSYSLMSLFYTTTWEDPAAAPLVRGFLRIGPGLWLLFKLLSCEMERLSFETLDVDPFFNLILLLGKVGDSGLDSLCELLDFVWLGLFYFFLLALFFSELLFVLLVSKSFSPLGSERPVTNPSW